MAALDAGAVITQMYNGVVTHVQSKASVLIGDGQDLAAVLLLITISWAVVNWMLSGDGTQALMDTFGSMVRFGVVSLMLAGWLTTVGNFFHSNITDLTAKVGGSQTVGSSLNLMLDASQQLFFSVDYEKRTSKCKEVDQYDPATGLKVGTQVVCETPGAKGSEPSFIDIMFNLPVVLMTFIFKALALLFMIMMIVAFLLVVFMAEVLFGAALTFGPVLVPWLIWQRTVWLFDGWLKFMIAASLTKVVAFYMIGVNSGVIAIIKSIADRANVTSAADMLAVDEMAALLICINCAIAAFMMWQVPSIAQGLISGTGGASTAKFGQGILGRGMAKAPTSIVSGGASQLNAFTKALRGDK